MREMVKRLADIKGEGVGKGKHWGRCQTTAAPKSEPFLTQKRLLNSFLTQWVIKNALVEVVQVIFILFLVTENLGGLFSF